MLKKEELLPSDVIVLAVAHQEFVHDGWMGIMPLLKDNTGVVVDVHRILDKTLMPENIKLLRL